MSDLSESIRRAVQDFDHGRIVEATRQGCKLAPLPQKSIVESALDALAELCPDWVIAAEPLRSVIKAERETNMAAMQAERRRIEGPTLVK
jgi:hypothetical protein